MGIELRSDDGVAEVVIDFPPVNALPVAGLVRPGRRRDRGRRRPGVRAVILAAEGRGFCAGRGHQGDAAARPGTRRCSAPTAAASPRSPPSTTARCRSSPPCTASASAAASAWPATPTSSSPRRRHLRPARGRPRRPRRGDAPVPAGAAAPDARHGLHLPHRLRRSSCSSFGTVLEVVPPAGAAGRGAGRRRRDRRQEPGRHPAGQAVAERHRPGRRQAQLPVRAGVHLRAQPHRRLRRGPPGVRRTRPAQ